MATRPRESAGRHASVWRSHRQCRRLFEHAPVPAFAWQRREDDFFLVAYNEAALAFTRGGIEGLVGASARGMYPDRPDVHARFGACLGHGEAEDVVGAYTLRTTGETKQLRCTFVPFRPDLVLVLVQDETEVRIRERGAREAVLEINERLRRALAELEAAQQQIAQQERLRALGQMASGIAHDLNNALAPVLGFSELLRQSPELAGDGGQLGRYLRLIEAGAQDAVAIVQRLREFYRPREASEGFEEIDVREVVRLVVELTEPRWRNQAQAEGRTIRVETELEAVPPVLGHAAELREALTNLVGNAVDALPAGGTVALRTGMRGGCVSVEVADTGTGMGEETRRRCLEPFYTTKGDKGTGLGLAMVHGTVGRHDGSLEIVSEPGRGTTVRLLFPPATATAGRWPAEDAGGDAGGDAAGGAANEGEGLTRVRRRVLLVDDEEPTRHVQRELLVHAGYDVEEAANAEEAVALVEMREFDVVVTDRAMAGLGGDALAAALARVSPGTPVIMVTGMGDVMEAEGIRPAHVAEVLSKPVTAGRLRDAVERAVAGARGGAPAERETRH